MCSGEQRRTGGDKLHPQHRSLLQPRGAQHWRDSRGVHHRHPPRHDLPRYHSRPCPQGQCGENKTDIVSHSVHHSISFLRRGDTLMYCSLFCHLRLVRGVCCGRRPGPRHQPRDKRLSPVRTRARPRTWR